MLDRKVTRLVSAEPQSQRAQITGPCDLNRRPTPLPQARLISFQGDAHARNHQASLAGDQLD